MIAPSEVTVNCNYSDKRTEIRLMLAKLHSKHIVRKGGGGVSRVQHGGLNDFSSSFSLAILNPQMGIFYVSTEAKG